jgi:hypothetical protein
VRFEVFTTVRMMMLIFWVLAPCRLVGIFRVFWPNVLSNEELWSRANEEPVAIQIKLRKWRALYWNPQGQRKRGRPKMNWRRSVEDEARKEGKTWRELRALARNRIC